MISFREVSKTYNNGTKALNNIDLTIEEGEFVVIVGLSGAGKSTLLRTINRMHEVTEGAITIDGTSITEARGKNLYALRRGIGMIFQQFNIVKRSSVLKNVLAGRVGYHSTLRMILGMFPSKDKGIAFEALRRVNLLEKAYVRADQLSGGQQQRVSIARALAQEPKVFLADEPVASLDPLTTRQVMDDLQRINRELGITMVVNLHSMEIARKYATRIIGLKAGEVVFDGPIAEATPKRFMGIYGESLEDEDQKGNGGQAHEEAVQ